MMKTSFFVASVLALVLTGCASHALNKWASDNKPLAQQGKMKWSEYYSQLYKQAESSSISNKASVLERTNIMIFASQEYEIGRMSKEQFDYFTRMAQVAEQRDNESDSARSRQAWAAALQGIGNSYKQNAPTFSSPASTYQPATTYQPAPAYQAPVQTNCRTYGNQTNCTSQ